MKIVNKTWSTFSFIMWNSFKLTFNWFSIAFDNVRPFGPERPWGARAGIITSEVDFNLYNTNRTSLFSISSVLIFKWNQLKSDLLWIGGEFGRKNWPIFGLTPYKYSSFTTMSGFLFAQGGLQVKDRAGVGNDEAFSVRPAPTRECMGTLA